jgi:2-furoyl-CoA dehydrogenase large subunit
MRSVHAARAGALRQDHRFASCLATDKAVFQGEPVAAVAAETAAIAMDAGQLIEVDYEMLDAVVDPEQALEDKIVVHEAAGTNRVWNGVFEFGDVDKAFKDAAHVVKIDRMHFHRFASTPLENNACVAEWTRQGDVDFLCNNSFIGFAVQLLAPGLRLPMEKIRSRTYDVGGSFGIKIWNYVYMALAALASRKCDGQKVKWSETRTEHLLASGHGNERTFLDTEVALDKDGVITGIRSRHIDDCYLGTSAAGNLRRAELSYRLYTDSNQQVSCRTEPRLFPYAASMVYGTRRRYLRT